MTVDGPYTNDDTGRQEIRIYCGPIPTPDFSNAQAPAGLGSCEFAAPGGFGIID